MAPTVARFIKIWLMMASRAAQSQLLTSWAGVLFLIGKIVRFLLFFVFLFAVLSSSKTLAGYSREQVIFFFLVFNLVDIMIQFFFRGVYQFRSLVISGNYDLDLLKPLPSFFRPLFGWTDILDFITLVPLWVYFLWFVFAHQFFITPLALILFFLLLVNSLILAFAFHLFVCGICVLTTEIDHLVWIYRDLTNMARFPTDIYQRGIQAVLTFTIPVVILITIPAKALLGLLSWQWVIFSFVISEVFLWVSLRFWKYALTHYSSASS
ncbi:MAG: ABC-2 type transport system permease protein [Microgenomates group bacterium LiPW_31]|nr:MAG: ABC-2 type transport system permease protein [Microgenomates group bacterium LiPW_31]